MMEANQFTNQFIDRAESDFDRISYIDSLGSSFPVYFFIAIMTLYIGGLISFLSGFRNAAWVFFFFIIIAGVVWVWVKLYQYYELRSPLKKKVFHFRLSQALRAMNAPLENLKKHKRGLTATALVNGKGHAITLGYSQNLWANMGGIVPGTPVSTGGLRAPNPRTWFLKITGTSPRFQNLTVGIEFSARQDDEDTDNGFGVRTYDIPSSGTNENKSAARTDITHGLKRAIDQSILKGTLEIQNGNFTLTIFDNVYAIYRWRRPVLRYKNYPNDTRLAEAGIPAAQAAFYGTDKLLQLLLSE
ncbi:MAG: hypothetical protein Q7U02_12985 [Desulfosalsimonadaceae bacterium]|nr:hypothetical protein [Desulfosalsimonadaceae bacterium]